MREEDVSDGFVVNKLTACLTLIATKSDPEPFIKYVVICTERDRLVETLVMHAPVRSSRSTGIIDTAIKEVGGLDQKEERS